MGISSKILPMSDENSTIEIITGIGKLDFHDFLIKHKSEPDVLEVNFSNVKPANGVIQAIKDSDAVIIGPSNPITSILPIISLDGVREALKKTHVIAVSPIIGSNPVSGPAGKFMQAMDIEVSSFGVAQLYSDFLDDFFIDDKDEFLSTKINQIINKVTSTNTIMNNLDAKINLASQIIENVPHK